MMGYLVKEEKTSPLEGEGAEQSEVGEGASGKPPQSASPTAPYPLCPLGISP